MLSTKNYGPLLGKNKPFLFFVLSQGISCLGDSFQAIAATILIVRFTGSGLSAGFGMLCMPLCSKLLSPWAGSLGDILPEKFMLVAIDLLRGVAVLLFVYASNIFEIYMLMLLLSILSIFYSPSCRKIMVNILRNDELLQGNSIMSGISGFVFLVGPVSAGIFVGTFGVKGAFIINSISFAASAFIILFIKKKNYGFNIVCVKARTFYKGIFSEMKAGIEYCMRSPAIKELIAAGTVVCFGAASINIAFYSFVFDVLKITEKGWGVILSVFNGTNLVAMVISFRLESKIDKSIKFYIYTQFIIIALAWAGYGMAGDIVTILVLLAVEGVGAALLGIFLGTRLQACSNKNFIGRISGFSDIINNMGKIAGIGFAYFLLGFSDFRTVFLINSLILSIFAIYKLFFTKSFAH